MGLPETRAELVGVLEAVSGIGTVHAYDRYTRSWDQVLALFKSGDAINGCIVTRTSRAKQQVTAAVEVANVFRIRFVRGLRDADASEHTFQALLDAADAAIDAWENAITLSGRTTRPDFGPMRGAVGLQVDTVEVRMFGTVLCHYAECRLCVQEPAT